MLQTGGFVGARADVTQGSTVCFIIVLSMYFFDFNFEACGATRHANLRFHRTYNGLNYM